MRKENVQNKPIDIYIEVNNLCWGFVESEAELIKLNKEDISFCKAGDNVAGVANDNPQ